MRIDQTRIKAFWSNPERYRLTYQCDIVPTATPYGLARGIAFHTTLDLATQGKDSDYIKGVLFGQIPDEQGRLLKLAPSPIANGWEMARAYLENCTKYEIVRSEAEFEFPAYDHYGVGRLDQLVRDKQGAVWLLEFKTGNTKTRLSVKENDWLNDKQADFEIMGARALGYDPIGVKVQYVIETVPPTCVDEIEVYRTEGQLERTRLFIQQTCEIIEDLKRDYGIDTPWPHLSNYPCIGCGDRCEYGDICGRQGKLVPEELEGFSRREEHLTIMRNLKLKDAA